MGSMNDLMLSLEELRFVWKGLPSLDQHHWENEMSIARVSELMLAVDKVMKALDRKK